MWFSPAIPASAHSPAGEATLATAAGIVSVNGCGFIYLNSATSGLLVQDAAGIGSSAPPTQAGAGLVASLQPTTRGQPRGSLGRFR